MFEKKRERKEYKMKQKQKKNIVDKNGLSFFSGFTFFFFWSTRYIEWTKSDVNGKICLLNSSHFDILMHRHKHTPNNSKRSSNCLGKQMTNIYLTAQQHLVVYNVGYYFYHSISLSHCSFIHIFSIIYNKHSS